MKTSELKALKKKALALIPAAQKKLLKGDKLGEYAYFKLVGGPHHGNTVRMYAPWDELVYEDGSVYEVSPPLGASQMWIYIHKGNVNDG